MDSVTCAKCGGSVPLDGDHVRVEGEHIPRTEWANVDEFAFHEGCWSEVTSEWSDPA